MTKLFDFLTSCNPISTENKQTFIWNGVEYENRLLKGFNVSLFFSDDKLTIHISGSFFDEPVNQRTPELGEITLTLDDLSNLYNISVDKLRTIFDKKESITKCQVVNGRITKYQMPNNECLKNNFTDFFIEKYPNLVGAYLDGLTFSYSPSPAVTKINIDEIIQNFIDSYIEFGCK